MKVENKKTIKLSYISGLKSIISEELKRKFFNIVFEEKDCVFVDFSADALLRSKELRSVSRAYLVLRDSKYNPLYIANHKSILGDIIDIIVDKNRNDFNSFKISCAGSDSPEIKSISKYIKETYFFKEKDEADLKIHLIKDGDVWEIGAQITPRPLSTRSYRVMNMGGAIDATVAYAMNSLCDLEKKKSYLNVFSGSGTLLIEAGLSYGNLEKIVGFDRNKKNLSLSVKNIKKSGLIKKIEIKEGDIADNPNWGKFDVITSDLPFGMLISKNEDLYHLYESYVKYCEVYLNQDGYMVAYTSRFDIFESVLVKSKFKVIKSIDIQSITSVNTYLKSKIMVCVLDKQKN